MRRSLCLFSVLLMVAGFVSAQNAYGPGRVDLPLMAGQDAYHVGWVTIHNNNGGLKIEVELAENANCDFPDGCDWDCDWRMLELHIHAGWEDDPIPVKKGNPVPGKFMKKYDYYGAPASSETYFFDFVEDFDGFAWGSPFEPERLRQIAVHADVVKVDPSTGQPLVDPLTGEYLFEEGAWAKGDHDFHELGGSQWGWWLEYMMAHKKNTHFIDSPVGGLIFHSPTEYVYTDESGAAPYFPGESAKYYLGTQLLGDEAVLDHKVSPLDLFPASDIDDPRVINVAMLLQSLDADASPKGGIEITADVEACFDQAVGSEGYIEDWTNDGQVDVVLEATIDNCFGIVDLVAVSRDEAKAHLDETLNNSMFRKMISRTPDLGSAKAKMNIMPVWFPALRANGEPATYMDGETAISGIPYFDEDGNLIRVATEAKPIITTFTDADPVTGAHDAWAAISRDDGNTWKRKNISRSGDRTSFTTKDGVDYFGHCKKPVFQAKGNKILMAWTSKYAKGGKPAYSIKLDDDYAFDDPYWTDDIWGVAGPQRSVDYTTEGFPEVGEVPYSAVWTCRGIILAANDLMKAPWNDGNHTIGQIVWFKPERLTSARRDANLIFLAGGSGAGFGLVWQEDPKGLRPGKAVGPGPGWGGATTHHKTDIWYSYLTWGNHSKVDLNFVAGGDPEHELDHIARPKALVPLSLPVRLSDNDVLNTKNMMLDETTAADDVAYLTENLTRCVKFEDGKKIVEADDPDAWLADYTNLRAMPDDHQATMNCTNCHVPFGMEPMADIPTQGAPIPVVVVDAATQDFLGGFNNGDCVSCHFSHIVPRDRLIAMAPSLDEMAKFAECDTKGGIWKDGTQDGGEILEAYYPYEGYPYIYDDADDPDGTHRYGLELPGLLVADPLTDTPDFYTFTNFAGNQTSVGITLGVDGIAGTADDLLMDGDTGASRGNIFLQSYVKDDGTTSAWAIITYEETKGAGSGPPENTGEQETHRDDYIPESGKNAIYHSFDFQNPDLVSAGNIMNVPECATTESVDGYGNEIVMPVMDGENITPIYLETEAGDHILDWKGRPQIAYENARRGRFILQGTGAVRNSRTVMLNVYKMGMEGGGHPSDIMAHRWVIPEDEIVFKYKDGKINGVESVVGNPYRFENIVGNRVYDPVAEVWHWGSGPVNMSSVTPTVTTPSSGDPEHDDAYGAVKVVEWTQTVDPLADLSDKNHFEDARAHRGQLRGDFVMLGYSYTPNWAASRNGNDNYDFFIRRSFNGGQTWTTKPASQGGTGVTHCITWTYPSGTASPGTKVEECNTFAAGEFEGMRNLSQLKNNKESVIEPRIVAVPGTIKDPVTKTWTGLVEDKQNQNVFYVAWGTSTNPKKDPITGEIEEPTPADLYWTFSMDKGESYFVDEWIVNPDSDGQNAGETVFGTPWMAKGDQEQGEVQLRMTPDGSRFYASWLDEGAEGSDIVFRRIMPSDFLVNNATP